MIVQKLKSTLDTSFHMAERYYTIISALNELCLTQRELQVLSFIATNDMSVKDMKTSFCKEFSTTVATVNNVIYKLKKLSIITKDGKALKIHPSVSPRFDEGITLQIKMLLKDG